MDVGFAGPSRHARARAKLAALWQSGASRAFIHRSDGPCHHLDDDVRPSGRLWRLEHLCFGAARRQLATVGARHLEAQLSLSLVSDSLSLAAINVLQATSIASPAVTATWVTNRQGSVPDGRPYRLP